MDEIELSLDLRSSKIDTKYYNNHIHTQRYFLTSIFRQFASIDLVLHYVGPVEGALVEVEVQGDGVPQAGHQNAELALVQVDAADLVPVGENDEGLERVWRRQRTPHYS